MENELTRKLNLADNVVKNMEEDIEQKPPVDKEGVDSSKDETKKTTARLTQRQEVAKKAWQRIIDEKRKKGEEVTEEDIKNVNKSIEKGELPRNIAGGSGDGKFENFDTEKYEGSGLEDLAKLLKHAGENNAATQDFINNIANMAREAAAGGEEELAKQFIRDMAAAANGAKTPEQAMQEEQTSNTNNDPSNQVSDAEVKVRLAKERSGNPRNVQEVAQSIIFDEGSDRWGREGTFPLLDENDNLNQANFVRWFRERLMYHHLSNSRDYQLQLGNLVGITNQFGSTTSIFSMDKDRGQYFLDDKSGRVLDKLANQLKNELWLFSNMRNHDLLYQEYMGSDSELPKFFAQVHGKEEITQPDSLKTIMTMSKDFSPEGGDTAVGDSVRKAYEIYFYASDFPELQKILGKDSIFFKKEGFIDALKIIENIPGTDTSISPEGQHFIDKIFKNGGLDPAAFIKEMNPFNDQNKPEFNKKIMREMVKRAISEKYGLEYGLGMSINETYVNGKPKAPEREFRRKDLEYAETWAWILTRWTGAAGRNDTDAIGFDAQTKLLKLRDYRVRQSKASRAGQFGNEYDLPVFKALMSDFFNGITVEKRGDESDRGINLTPFEVFRRMDQCEDTISQTLNGRKFEDLSPEDKNIVERSMEEKKKLAERLNFEQSTQKAFYANHINRAFESFHSTMGAEEMRLEEIVKWDPFRGVILDRGKFEEQVKEKFLKPIRYAFSTYAQLDFGKMTRIQVPGKTNPDGTPMYKTVTNAEKFFGPEVLKDLRPKAAEMYAEKIKKGEMTSEEAWQKYLSNKEGGRPLLWKRAAMAKMAAHIKSHRQFGNGYTPFTAGMVETLYDALKSIKEVDVHEGEDETGLNYAKRFLDDDDIKWIREHSGTTARQLFIKDFVVKGVGTGLIKGAWEGAGLFVKDIFK